MLIVSARTVGLLILYFLAMSGRPGAIIEVDAGSTKVYNETCHEVSLQLLCRRTYQSLTTAADVHFLVSDQLRGFSGSLFHRRSRISCSVCAKV